MSKQTIVEAPDVELILRDVPERYTLEGLVEEQYELEIGGWTFDEQLATVTGIENMIEGIDELRESLLVVRGALLDERALQERS